jgi:hypothetical protein
MQSVMLNCIYTEDESVTAEDPRIAEKASTSSNPAHDTDAAPVSS